ncbi:serine hydrolase domain-containing protein [Nocardiopsis metallicus]|uniref:CubicO group peptidase (Beta-lactamase class C family) n=1 Tax=Nocardiopsis metallicus TaxID=179819 RepID=A0A840WHV5_9ACTN|nr:serine hydrolase domain-containing protein [Nocardiopsis metallicus]MBB5491495.1 CubicO group peptidase (beta-lactamase class C family) [Nocardiopsis metallicus]
MAVDAAHINALLDQAVTDEVTPGAVWLVGGPEGPEVGGQAGLLDPANPASPMVADTLFDIASLTKVTAVWSVIGTLWEDSALRLEDPLGVLLPDLSEAPLGQVTVHQLLTHTAGVPPRAQLKTLYGTDPAEIRHGVLHEQLHHTPGEQVQYTDRAALILGFLAEGLTGTGLTDLAHDRAWSPLGMFQTRFGPLPEDLVQRTAPTELDQESGQHLRGVPHDFSARLLGGVSGIAGAFSTAPDLGRFLTYMLTPGNGATFGKAWVNESLQVQTGGLEPLRGLFWHPAPGTSPAEDIWVHYGFTGTGAWVCPRMGRWGVLLTNKLYYTRDRGPVTELRGAFQQAVFS